MYYIILHEVPFPLPKEKSNKNKSAIIMKQEERGGADETVFCLAWIVNIFSIIIS